MPISLPIPNSPSGNAQATAPNIYYNNANQFGEYQFVSLTEIIANFNAAFVGEGKILANIQPGDISFHAHRALQELTYDTLKSCKTQEIEVCPSLKMPLPHDYVNYVKLTWSDSNGIEHIIYPARNTSHPFAIEQNESCGYLFTGSNLKEQQICDEDLDVVCDSSKIPDLGDYFKDLTWFDDGTTTTFNYEGNLHGGSIGSTSTNSYPGTAGIPVQSPTAEEVADLINLYVIEIVIFCHCCSQYGSGGPCGPGYSQEMFTNKNLQAWHPFVCQFKDMFTSSEWYNLFESGTKTWGWDTPWPQSICDGIVVPISGSLFNMPYLGGSPPYFTGPYCTQSEDPEDPDKDPISFCTYDPGQIQDFEFTIEEGGCVPYSDTWNSFSSTGVNQVGIGTSTSNNPIIDANNYFQSTGQRYGIDPQYAQANGSFFIDCRRGNIHFSSNLSGQTIILKYISDGHGTDDELIIPKLAEEAMYKWIAYGCVSARTDVPEYVIQRFKREKFSETRKAKIRLSNIKLEEISQVFRGKSKWIKH